VSEALREAHYAGLIHRDIKPSNIMMDSVGRAKVTDFGIAYVSEAKTKLTRDGSIIGTPEYLSPEQCEGKPLDGRSDIYSLGVTLYEVLTGKTPYEADTPVSMLMKIVKGDFPPISELNPQVPKSAQEIVEKMMSTKPEDRYGNADILIKALASVEKDKKVFPAVAEDLEQPTRKLTPTRKVKSTKKVTDPKTSEMEGNYQIEGKRKSMWNALAVAAVIILLMGGAFAAKVLFIDKNSSEKKNIPQVTTSQDSTKNTEAPSGTAEPSSKSNTVVSTSTLENQQKTEADPSPQSKEEGTDAKNLTQVTEDQPGNIKTDPNTSENEPGTITQTKETKSEGNVKPESESKPVSREIAKSSDKSKDTSEISESKPAVDNSTKISEKVSSQVPKVSSPSNVATKSTSVRLIEKSTVTSTPSGKSAKLLKKKSKAKPAPPANSMVLTCLGDNDKGDIITAYTQSTLASNNFTIIDGHSVQDKQLGDIARFHLVISVKQMGTTTLQYYGQTTQQYTVGLTMKGISTKNGRIVAGPVTKIVKYTSLNEEENIKAAVENLIFKIQSKLKNLLLP